MRQVSVERDLQVNGTIGFVKGVLDLINAASRYGSVCELEPDGMACVTREAMDKLEELEKLIDGEEQTRVT